MMTRLACLALLALPAAAMAGNWTGDAGDHPSQAQPDYGYLAQHANPQPARASQEKVVRGGLQIAKVAAFFVTGQYSLSPTLSLSYRNEPADTTDMVSRAESCSRLGLHYRF